MSSTWRQSSIARKFITPMLRQQSCHFRSNPYPLPIMSDSSNTSRKALTVEDVKHVAKLSRLALGEAQLAHLAPQLEAILGYVAKISEVIVEGVEPMAHPL